jgi:NADH-quinone oxidoreductase subunit H
VSGIGEFLLSALVFPGLLFASVVGLLYVGIDRKITGRLQHRIGPPIWQEFLDFGKLLTKEDITPAAAQGLIFNFAPALALGAVVTVLLLLPVGSAQPALGGVADLVVILYLLNIPAISMMLAGYASGTPFGMVGAWRYVVQLFGYELVFALAVLSVAARVGTLSAGELAEYQMMNGWLIFDPRLWPAFIAIIIAAQAKLLRVPFDIPEAHTEIVHGPLTEYSGPKLAIWRLAYCVETIAVLGLLATLFLGAPATYAVGALVLPPVVDFLIKVLALVFVTTLMRNVMARLRIDRALRFFWTYGLLLVAISLVLVV